MKPRDILVRFVALKAQSLAAHIDSEHPDAEQPEII
jgi:hypothetical protein